MQSEKERQQAEDKKAIEEWLAAGNKPTICETGAVSDNVTSVWTKTKKPAVAKKKASAKKAKTPAKK
jgi:predicted transcriptional regulator